MRRILYLLPVLILWSACQEERDGGLIEDLMYDNKQLFNTVLDHPEKFEVQIIYTQIDRDSNNVPTFTPHHYRLDSLQYFYPASTVKFPVALLALEKINMLQWHHKKQHLNKFTPLRIDSIRPPQTAVSIDSTAPNLHPTVAHYIKKIFTVSDNDAYNRLYEFVGQDYMNVTLAGKKYNSTRILHRLSAPDFDYTSNRFTNPITFYKGDTIAHQQTEVEAQGVYMQIPDGLKNTLKGKAYLQNDGTRIEQPFNFAQKNFFSLNDFDRMMRTVMFPEFVEDGYFSLTQEDYKFLYQYMSMLPRESKSPIYSETEYPDGYCKFFMYGDTKERIPDNIRIYNKVGFAYGYLTDCSYIVDFENGVEFMLTATIHVNDNETYNDGVYEYDEIGLPFMANLGRVIYDYESKREKKHQPDFYWIKVENYE